MTPNRLRGVLESGQPALNAWCAMASSHAAEILAHLDFDSITIDLQHGAMDGADAFRMLQAIHGAEGIITPMINNADEAARLVGACRYPPLGYRSFGPTRAALATGARSNSEYAAHANAHVLVFAMIETQAGLDNLDAIQSVEGLDGSYVGPGDLSMALGATPSMRQNPGTPAADAVIEAITHCLDRTKSLAKYAAIHTDGAETARLRFEQGFNLCTLQSDARLLADGAKRQIALARGRT